MRSTSSEVYLAQQELYCLIEFRVLVFMDEYAVYCSNGKTGN
jgi:hypothetical protein